MTSNPEVIDLTSSSSSSSSSDCWGKHFPSNLLPLIPYLTKEQAKKKKHDVGGSNRNHSPTASDFSGEIRPWTGYPPSQRELVSPFLCTSDEESSEDEYDDPSFLPPSTSERPQARSRRSNPPIPKSREVVVGLRASSPRVPHCRGRGNDKGKGKLV